MGALSEAVYGMKVRTCVMHGINVSDVTVCMSVRDVYV